MQRPSASDKRLASAITLLHALIFEKDAYDYVINTIRQNSLRLDAKLTQATDAMAVHFMPLRLHRNRSQTPLADVPVDELWDGRRYQVNQRKACVPSLHLERSCGSHTGVGL